MKNNIQDILPKISNDINKFQGIIQDSIHWVNSFLKSEKQERTYRDIVSIRREVKKIKYALSQNPSAALYGESQVGKSYLIKNLLSLPQQQFIIRDKAANVSYNFLEEINPKGDGVEATSVITRFSSNVKTLDEKYPIVVKLLSPKDIALFLIDSCFSELRDSLVPLDKKEATDILKQVEAEYAQSTVDTIFFSEDDMYDIRDYLKEHFRTAAATILAQDIKYWTIVPKLIEKMPPEDWYKVLEIFWSKNEDISQMFNLLIRELKKMNFASTGYIEFEAVLRKYGTLLDVNRLHQLSNNKIPTDAKERYIKDVNILIPLETGGNRVHNINKSHLCALTAELVFELDKSLEETKPFLSNLDLLDFPGARARKELKASVINEEISSMILRGKVAYIFNKYSAEYLISNLLFCNRSGQIESTYIPRLLNNWIEKYIGNTPEEREEFFKTSSIPPLFIIYTWFNVDLSYSSTNDKNKGSLADKWTKRFTRIFENEIVSENHNWDKNWTVSNPYFQNQYMLRDLHLSEEKSNIFTGYAENGEEKNRVEPTAYPTYWEELKSSFTEFPFVKNHFSNPEKAWNESATLNNDGSQPIIDSLSISSNNMVRVQKFIRVLQKLLATLEEELNKNYHSDEADKLIIKATQKAGKVHLNLDISFGRDPYFFGKLMQNLLITEGEIFNYYHDKITNIELIEQANISEYIAIRLANQGLSVKATFEENVEVLRKTYKLSNFDAVIEYFEEEGIDLNELFFGSLKRLKSNSLILAEGLQEYWFEKYLVESRFETLINQGFSAESVTDLLDNIKVNYKRLNVSEKIAENIRQYVDRYDKINKAEKMIADISAAIINKFINTMGYDYFTDEEKEGIQKTNQENELGLVFDHSNLQYAPLAEKDIADLFETMDSLHDILNEIPINIDAIKNVPSFSHFVKWRDLMKISFVANCDIPTYDILANNQLGEILEKTIAHSFETPNLN